MVDIGGFRGPFLELTGWDSGEALPDHVEQAYWVFHKLCCAASRGEHHYAQSQDPGFGRYNAELIAGLYRSVYVIEHAPNAWWMRELCRSIEDAAERFHASRELHEAWTQRSIELAPTLGRWSDDPTDDIRERAVRTLTRMLGECAAAEGVDVARFRPFPSLPVLVTVRSELERLSPDRPARGPRASSKEVALARLGVRFGLLGLRKPEAAKAENEASRGNTKPLRLLERKAAVAIRAALARSARDANKD